MLLSARLCGLHSLSGVKYECVKAPWSTVEATDVTVCYRVLTNHVPRLGDNVSYNRVHQWGCFSYKYKINPALNPQRENIITENSMVLA